MSNSSNKLLKVVLLLGALGFLLVEAGDHVQHGTRKIGVSGLMVVNKEGAGNMKQALIMGQRNSMLELNYINKRTVPKGSDPIHDGKSPPGRA